ncbi:MAG: L-lactate permease [Phototrophicales bacterium]
MDVILAALPPLIVLILMVGRRWGGSKAGTVGWILALLIATLRFGAGIDVQAYAHLRALILTIDVVLIVWAALLLYLVVDQAGALQVIADWFTALTGDDVLRVLLLGWVFTSFLQGVGGFGVPVAIAAPLLVGLGLPPLAAVVIPSIGHAWAVTFGSLGSSYITLTGVTGLDGYYLAPESALILGIMAVACGVMAAFAYAGWRGLQRGLPAIVIIGVTMATVQYVAATSGLWNIASALGGLAGLIIGLGVTRLPFYHTASSSTTSAQQPTSPRPSFLLAISGYIILVILAVFIKGVEPVKQIFSPFELSIDVPQVITSKGWVTEADSIGLSVLGHTGAILLYSALIASFLFDRGGYYPPGTRKKILTGVRKKGIPPAIGILTMMCMAIIMANSGMTREIAQWMSRAVPADLYAFVATTIGALGAFMTGSNTNSNAVFAVLQMDTAILMSLSVPTVLAIQTAAGAIASLLAPAKIMVGASTVGLSGDEGRVLRALFTYGGGLLCLIALIGFVMLQIHAPA